MHPRIRELHERLRAFEGAAVAFSGGVDSTFLLAVAKLALGERLLALIGASPTYPQSEHQAALELAAQLGVAHRVLETAELENAEFRATPPHRCYICKTVLFRAMRQAAVEADLDVLLEGSNADDAGDSRDGDLARPRAGSWGCGTHGSSAG